VLTAQRACRFAIAGICLAALVAGIVWNGLFAVADLSARRNQTEATRLAMRLMPANAAYPAQLADELYASDPAEAKSLLRKAVNLNRFDAASWIQLGLLSEAGNDLPQAENALLQAASVDTTFLPSWSLANFYFRRQNVARFWDWAQKAAQMVPDDATPLFRLAWYVNPNALEIENRLQMKRPVVEGQFVNFLLTQGDPEAVTEAASHLMRSSNKESTETLLRACDWLLERKRPDLALALWNGLAARTSYPSLGADSPVTNSDFGKSPLSHGFDWRLTTVEGVTSFLNTNPNALGFEFSGNEPDSFLLLSQTAPLHAKKTYTFAVEYGTSGIPPGSGIEWQVTDARTGAVLARTTSLSTEQRGEQSGEPAAEQGSTATICFTTPEETGFVNLSLLYQRQPGTVRVEGKLALKAVRLSAATAGDCAAEKISDSRADSPAL
jgi:tetratricopeptide (TPR) repeat protein